MAPLAPHLRPVQKWWVGQSLEHQCQAPTSRPGRSRVSASSVMDGPRLTRHHHHHHHRQRQIPRPLWIGDTGPRDEETASSVFFLYVPMDLGVQIYLTSVRTLDGDIITSTKAYTTRLDHPSRLTLLGGLSNYLISTKRRQSSDASKPHHTVQSGAHHSPESPESRAPFPKTNGSYLWNHMLTCPPTTSAS